MPPPAKDQLLGQNASLLLAALRVGAALAVALTHLPLFLRGRLNVVPNVSGNTAVCVFFVLSGFVMRYVTVARVTTARAYCIDRVSRMYSVMIPALLLTVALEWFARIHAPVLYAQAATPDTWNGLSLQILENLSFTVGWWNHGQTPLSNGAFWSLSFEVVYYVLYGLLLYAQRLRWILVPLLLLLVGPAMALLFPVWLLGAGCYDLYAWLARERRGIVPATAAATVYVGVLFLLRRRIASSLHAADVFGRRVWLTHLINGWSLGRAAFHGAELTWLDRFSTSYFLVSTVLAALLLPTLLVAERFLPDAPGSWVNRVRLIADSTFSLYLLHLPALLFLMEVTHGPWTSRGEGLAMLAAVVVLCIPTARLFDRLKNSMRSQLRQLFAP